ncbi:phage tail protein [Burkholderia pseudomallei]|uniref:phage tail protein n=1 Tax=Burkholderia pseudomallei TaxID=28450 RepID=UPI0020D1EC31|nr:phage tail protein [Burkholderia pseudomallei]
MDRYAHGATYARARRVCIPDEIRTNLSDSLPVFTWVPQVGTSGTTRFDVLNAQFGDGYSQTAANGINNAADVWPVSFCDYDDTVDAIHAFLRETKGARRFKWTPPRRAPGLFLCDPQGVTRRFEGGGISTLTATFKEVF